MEILLVIEAALMVFTYIRSKDEYRDFVIDTDRKKYIIRTLIPSALFLMDRINAAFWYSYQSRLHAKIAVLYGSKNSKHRLRLLMAEKLALMLAAAFVLTLLGALMSSPDAAYFIFSAVALFLIFYLSDREIEEQIKKRNYMLQYDFPEFLNKLVLLLNAGMTLPRAWEKIVLERKIITPLYQELKTTYQEVLNGKSETAAYEDFARRCRVKEITKFITVMLQSQRKGSNELVPILKLQSNECWQNRKSMAKKLGEEASTKLVFPLMIMFIGILIIVLIPAILQLRTL